MNITSQKKREAELQRALKWLNPLTIPKVCISCGEKLAIDGMLTIKKGRSVGMSTGAIGTCPIICPNCETEN